MFGIILQGYDELYDCYNVCILIENNETVHHGYQLIY